jgi:hypothetical protein
MIDRDKAGLLGTLHLFSSSIHTSWSACIDQYRHRIITSRSAQFCCSSVEIIELACSRNPCMFLSVGLSSFLFYFKIGDNNMIDMILQRRASSQQRSPWSLPPSPPSLLPPQLSSLSVDTVCPAPFLRNSVASSTWK